MAIINNKKSLKNRRKKLRNNMTQAEILLWLQIKNSQLSGYKFRRQHSIGRYIVDFYCPELKLAIELDGGHHNQNEQSVYDKERTIYLNSLNVRVIRYGNNEVIKNINGVFEDLQVKIIGMHIYPILLEKDYDDS
ncbi:MAG: hypothetical protein A2927_01100 [Candidatus Komeilibacteria bacterium RIFCSPLOWO2_01_FULL_45_10]|uniref:DUF559 domain-containing protein n=1 Tax=Candidatus Komeilibacteria bacterium RIFCSPLOWO2_01_FULL_45_10 TaxID=1798550 RepID=A0A1G2BL62_9BACT|nr:MAG: hypothetical protein A2927_01100 [Candidatus Komeilibacteria bacterium RIFCSPLOWO2_01_FULL_45_10]